MVGVVTGKTTNAGEVRLTIMKTFLKALVVFWPFFKSMVFHDRPVKEVLRQNVQFTALFALSATLTFVLYLTWAELVSRSEHVKQLTETNRALEQTVVDLEKQQYDGRYECRPEGYDKSRIIDLLEEDADGP